jgi:uncharacterized phage-associated protein
MPIKKGIRLGFTIHKEFGTMKAILGKKPTMISALSVAQYFLSFTDEEREEAFTHLKLQKLLYYAQGYFLATQKRPLFSETLQAWTHGPVVPEVYHIYKDYKNQPLPYTPCQEDFPELLRDFLNSVLETHGIYSAAVLRTMTHQEEPWIEAFNQGKSTPLNLTTMERFFRKKWLQESQCTEEDFKPTSQAFLDLWASI